MVSKLRPSLISKLLVAGLSSIVLAAVLALMIPDTGGYACRHLRRRNLHDPVPEGRALPGGHGDPHVGTKMIRYAQII